jgi:hypothetical protein
LYTVLYNSDPRWIGDEDHISNIIYCIEISERHFDNLPDAVRFLCECTSPITAINDLVPELKNKIKFDYILPESHIRPKHQLMPMSDMEVVFTTDAGDWSKH